MKATVYLETSVPSYLVARPSNDIVVLADFKVLDDTPEIEQATRRYHTKLGLPAGAIRDAAHLAFACHYRMDYLLTWNCAHIANAEIEKRLADLNRTMGMPTPAICTPEELMGTEGD